MNVIIAFDIGSSSIRCTAYSVQNKREISAIPNCATSVQVRSVQPNSGKIRLKDDNATMFDKMDQCVDELISLLKTQLGSAFQVVAVGFSVFVMNLVAVDKSGNFLGEEFTISYACNLPEVAKECQAIRDEVGPEQLDQMYQQTGTPIHSAYAPAQLRHLYKVAPPEELEKIAKWQTLASMCISRWTGKSSLPISSSEASWTGLLDFRQCTYDELTTSLLPESCRAKLPEIADFADAIVGLPEFVLGPNGDAKTKNAYWDRWPELQNAKLYLGLGDGAGANVGSKCSTSSRIAVTVGTSAAARVCLEQGIGASCTLERVPKGLFCYRIDRNHLLVGGALTDGGSVIEWVSQLLNLNTKESFTNCLEQVQALVEADCQEVSSSASGPNLVTIPFLSGERSTGFRDGASGAIFGLTRNVTPAHLFKSCLEGVSLRIRALVELLVVARGDKNEGEAPYIVASGKALEVNATWRQMVADSTGLRVVLDMDTSEGTSRGVAVLVAVALAATESQTDCLTLDEEALLSVKTAEPRQHGKMYFDRVAATQAKVIDALSPVWMEG